MLVVVGEEGISSSLISMEVWQRINLLSLVANVISHFSSVLSVMLLFLAMQQQLRKEPVSPRSLKMVVVVVVGGGMYSINWVAKNNQKIYSRHARRKQMAAMVRGFFCLSFPKKKGSQAGQRAHYVRLGFLKHLKLWGPFLSDQRVVCFTVCSKGCSEVFQACEHRSKD